jgi:kynureninase
MEKVVIKSLKDCKEADKFDDLSNFRDKFTTPDDVIYLCGNSLGLCPSSTSHVANRVIVDEWALNHIESWNTADWYHLPKRVGNKIGKLIGANNDETIVCDTATVNIFKCLGTATSIQKIKNPDRRVIVVEKENFPSDLYVVQGFVRFMEADGYEIRYFDANTSLDETLRNDVAVVLLSHVNFKTGAIQDMHSVTKKIHSMGAFVIWDLCHSVGAVPIQLNKNNADFAVGCTYKYLNGGPGSPGFIWINRKHQNVCWSPITGWFGHAQPFRMDKNYHAADDILRFLVGTPHVLQLSIIENSVDIILEADIEALRKKSVRMSELFISLMDEKCVEMELISPRNSEERGSHLSFRHPNAFEISKYLRKEKVIGDFRHPDVIRFAIAPLYLRFIDIWDAVDVIFESVKKAEKCLDYSYGNIVT